MRGGSESWGTWRTVREPRVSLTLVRRDEQKLHRHKFSKGVGESLGPMSPSLPGPPLQSGPAIVSPPHLIVIWGHGLSTHMAWISKHSSWGLGGKCPL